MQLKPFGSKKYGATPGSAESRWVLQPSIMQNLIGSARPYCAVTRSSFTGPRSPEGSNGEFAL